MTKRYTSEQLDFLRCGYQLMTIETLTLFFNLAFQVVKTPGQVKACLNNHRITCGRKGRDRLKKRTRQISEVQEQFIRDNYKGISAAEMTALFNTRFGTDKTLQQIKSFVHNHGINSGRTGHFLKGNAPWNKGTKGVMKPNSGNFKKGSIPANAKPLGFERISKDGFVEIKVTERNPHTGAPTRFKHKHRHVWEQTFGSIPEGMVVAFKDADKTNCDPDNLMLISRAELLTLNRHGYREMPEELKPSVLALAKLKVKTHARARETT
ncbi:MAG: HNH endonuclease [Desulfobacterales bacterium]|nr:HNH endonuclease [Desulfobacterales bacterium]